MKISFPLTICLALVGLLFWSSCDRADSTTPAILVFSKTTGYRHASIADGIAAIQRLGAEHGFRVDTTEDATAFREENLERYAAVVFLNTTGDVLDNAQEADLQRYLQAGRGFVGVHAAADTEYHWGWYNRLVGAQFASHPVTQEARLRRVDTAHASVAHLPDAAWVRTDEWYNYKNFYAEVNVLLELDETSYEGGAMGESHPIAWYHEYDGGRAWYTGLGHTPESYAEEAFLQHLLGGIQYAIGDNLPYQTDKIKAGRRPEDDRLDRRMLVEGQLYEPTEFTLLPNGDMLVAQRRGEILHYVAATGRLHTLAELDVYHETSVPSVNAEEGLMGIQAAPDFVRTGWIYLFYSPRDTSVNRLSRVRFRHDSLALASEQVILEFYSQREICCHTGGSIAFSGDGKYLYLSTGDNSTPFDEEGERYQNKGFAPLDERPGHEQYDARRSSANTNDLRGKILRIEVQRDGSYTIPDGNLFPPGMPDVRREVYVMGTRNPYRISVDPRTGYLYWGEVGPDARLDRPDTRGPRGYDEINQAKYPGFYGWPLFVGNNYPYHRYDYRNGRSGATFDPRAPLNESRNNTGLVPLPPARLPLIWYPYGESEEFPLVGSGGRNAMAGPVYYSEMHPAETAYPNYYDGKLFIYDWIRDWILLVSMHPDGSLNKLEPFLADTEFHNIIDMEVGPDGKIYLLEYGSGWYSRNPDAGISVIDYYSGNRPPRIDSIYVNKQSGKLPFELVAELDVTDPENHELAYEWQVGYETFTTTEPRLEVTLNEVDNYQVLCRVTDAEGATRASETLLVYAGNEAPTVDITVEGNQDIYFRGTPLTYAVTVDDDDEYAADRLMVQTKYTAGTRVTAGHLAGSGREVGQAVVAGLDCASCHKEREKSIGPSYSQIGERYRGERSVTTYLSEKIIRGGGGVWGEVAMAPHPTISPAEAALIVEWILSIDAPEEAVESLPAAGTITAGNPTSWEPTLQLWAGYTDAPPAGVKPLTTHKVVVLRDNYFNPDEWQRGEGVSKHSNERKDVWRLLPQNGWLKLDALDLTDVRRVGLDLAATGDAPGRYAFELRRGSPEGPVLASWEEYPAAGRRGQQRLYSPLRGETGRADEPLYLITRSLTRSDAPDGMVTIEGMVFDNHSAVRRRAAE